MVMKTSSVREIKNRLSVYLQVVANGERVTVTYRATTVAELWPPTRGIRGPHPSKRSTCS